MTFDDVRNRAFYFGMKPNEFWESTLSDVLYFIDAQDDFFYNQSRERWAIMRRQTLFFVNTQLTKEGQLKDDKQLFLLADEEEPEDQKVFDDPFSEENEAIFSKLLA